MGCIIGQGVCGENLGGGVTWPAVGQLKGQNGIVPSCAARRVEAEERHVFFSENGWCWVMSGVFVTGREGCICDQMEVCIFEKKKN